MRKALVVVLAVVATLWLVAPPAHAQAPAAAPAPKVTITGLVDNLTTWSKNMSMQDLDVKRGSETEWYGRTRVRPDITAEVGTTKFVLGLEFDYSYGQINDTGDQVAANGTPRGSEHFGVTDGSAINTDMARLLEVKWAYTQFELPWVPWKTMMRVGAQPFAATYKQSAYANSDFAGLHLESSVNPAVKLNFDWVQIQESSTGRLDGFTRNDDFAIIASVEITPFKGLDIRPIYSYMNNNGVASGAVRQSRGGVINNAAFFPNGASEDRHTMGIDARWRSGPFSLDPTVLYQVGTRNMVSSVGKYAGTLHEQDMSALFVDIRGGFQLGPLLLEAAAIYTTGNDAKSDIRDANRTVHYYQPLATDTSFYIGWAEIWALGVDYLQILNARAGGIDPGVSIGYDKYGLMRFGFRPSYAVTPAFTVRGAVTANWTAEEIDTKHVTISSNGLTPTLTHGMNGKNSYLGTELDLGFQWRFAPNVAFDFVYGYMFAGDALKAVSATSSQADGSAGITRDANGVRDIQTAVARVRYTF